MAQSHLYCKQTCKHSQSEATVNDNFIGCEIQPDYPVIDLKDCAVVSQVGEAGQEVVGTVAVESKDVKVVVAILKLEKAGRIRVVQFGYIYGWPNGY